MVLFTAVGSASLDSTAQPDDREARQVEAVPRVAEPDAVQGGTGSEVHAEDQGQAAAEAAPEREQRAGAEDDVPAEHDSPVLGDASTSDDARPEGIAGKRADAVDEHLGATAVPSLPEEAPKLLDAALCVPSQLYGLTETASVYSVPDSGGAATRMGGWYSLYTAWNPSAEGLNQGANIPTKIGANGLAAGMDGTLYAYARFYQYDSGYPSTMWNVSIRMMVKEPGDDAAWRWLDPASYKPATYLYSYESNAVPVAGAIDPVTGRYVWGGFRAGYFLVHELDLASGKRSVAGRIRVGMGTAADLNGDIAFDGAGNLYVLSHRAADGTLTITTVTAADLAAGRQTNAAYTAYDSWPSEVSGSVAKATGTAQYGDQVNGMAVGGGGKLYIGTKTSVYQINPLTAQVIGAPVTTNPYSGAGSDLAACAQNPPTTLTVQKDLRGSAVGREFTLRVASGGAEITSVVAKTPVPETSVLLEKAGPMMVTVGDTLALAETSAHLGVYAAALTCRIDGVTGAAGVVAVTGPGTSSGGLTIPAAAVGANITCTFTNTETTPPAVCTPATVYAINYRGEVGTLNTAAGNAVTNAAAWRSYYTGWSPSRGWTMDGMNALAVGRDGTIYALVRSFSATQRQVDVVRKTPTGGYESSIARIFGSTLPTMSGGAVDPSNGRFAFGGFEARTDGTYFVLYEFDSTKPIGAQIAPLGATRVTSAVHDVSNVGGDMAFDAAGNAHIVMRAGAGDGSANVSFTVVSAQHLAAGRSVSEPTHVLPGRSTVPAVAQSYGPISGVAFAANGEVYLSSDGNIWRIDPITGAQLGSVVATPGTIVPGSSITDLASCALPPTLTVKKDVQGRFNPGDQFGLSLASVGGSGAPVAQATTTGSADGVQSAQLGPHLVMAGGSYAITELAAGGGIPRTYDSRLRCLVDGPGGAVVIAERPATSGTVTIPTSVAGRNVTCVFTNRALPRGSLVWEKVESAESGGPDGPRHLGGSAWLLVGPDGAGTTQVAVMDCVARTPAGCEQGADRDPRAGHFRLTGLEWGAYRLVETTAPAGFRLDATPRAFTIGPPSEGAQLDWNLGRIVNQLVTLPGLPHTGGVGEQRFWAIAGVLALAAGLGAWMRRRATRSQVPGEQHGAEGGQADER